MTAMHSADDIAEAGRMLRAFSASMPGQNAPERATARRIEGAAAALGALAEPRQQTAECDGAPDDQPD